MWHIPFLLLCVAAALHAPVTSAIHPENIEPVASKPDPDFTASKEAVAAKIWTWLTNNA